MDGPRLHFVVGKGGVGKSTVSAALALANAAAGRRVLAVELGGIAGLCRTFDVVPPVPGAPVAGRAGVSVAYVEGEAALAEYLELVVPIRRVLAAVFASRLYQYFVAAAPGLKELMTVGKIWYEQDKTNADGKPFWDAIVVDAGASGHSLQYLQMPSAAARTFKSGLVHREAKRVEALLKDPARTAVHVVATAEEMPVTEAVEIVARLRGQLELPIGALIVNRCRETSPDGAGAWVDRLHEAAGDRRAADDGSFRTILDGAVLAGRRALAWQRVQERSLARLGEQTGLKPVLLPFLATEEFGINEVERLAGMLPAAAEAS